MTDKPVTSPEPNKSAEVPFRLMQLVYEVARLTSASLDLDEILDNAVRVLADLLGAEYATIQIHDTPRNISRLAAEYPPRGIKGQEVDQKSSPVTQILQNDPDHKPVVINSIEGREFGPEVNQIIKATGIKSAVVAPMYLQDNLIGTISISTYTVTHIFTDEEVETVQAVANQLATSIRNAQLVTDLKKQLRAERLRAQLSDTSAGKDIDELLVQAMRTLGEAMGARRARVQLVPPSERNA